ncbi:MAG: ATP-binding cassette domain-containing protein [Spirochaetales bacterium]|nr:ATP-binding cassette domain-containing protein [Spirochaetales bacterium]
MCSHQGIPDLTATAEDGHFAACYLSREVLDNLDKNNCEANRIDRRKPFTDHILEIENLSVHFPIKRGILRMNAGKLTAVDQVSIKIKRGETYGLVGESGCGKTTIATSIMRLITDNEGEIIFNNLHLNRLKASELRRQRRKIQMIFQDPYSSLNPRKSAGTLVGEPLKIHKLVSTRTAYESRLDELFTLVGLSPSLKTRVAHEFSGGQRQRLGIARALASNPDLIVCDEPISALDVSIQAQIINLLEDLQQELGLTYLFIAHDLSVVKHISDTITVMYLGKIVETAPCDELYGNPLHPYTQALLAAVPIPDPMIEQTREKIIISGEVISLMNRPAGCCFSDRCPYTMDICREQVPPGKNYGKDHEVACFKLSQGMNYPQA